MGINFTFKEKYNIQDLLDIMSALRSEQGCPWDREQTHSSIRKNLIEETYEVVEAIDNGDTTLLCEELGDLLLQVVFHAQMEKELGTFDFNDVCNGICQKLIERHPHIFADVIATTPAEVLSNWEDIKKRQKGQTTATETLRSVPKVLPALMRATKVQSRAAKTGFDYPDIHWAFSDLCSEVEELRQAIASGDKHSQEDELGDLLFSAVNVARYIHTDPEESLSKSCEKFIRRFEEVEAIALKQGIDIKQCSIDQLNTLWKQAKSATQN